MPVLTPENKADLGRLVAELSSQVDGYAGDDRALQAGILGTAQEIIRKVGKIPETQLLDDTIKAGEMAAKHLFIVWGAFEAIPIEGSITLGELAEEVDCGVTLLSRLARMLVSTGVLEQVGRDQLAHTDLSRIFTNQNVNSDLTLQMFAHALVPYCKMDEYFAWNGRKEPAGQNRNPLTFAYGAPEKYYWDIYYGGAAQKKIFMRAGEAAQKFWPVTAEYDFSWVARAAQESANDSRVMVVDVGGGNGHAVRDICRETGLSLGRCALQDMKSVTDEAAGNGDLKGLALMATDFHKEQPVKGALVYYLRHIVHDWNDEQGASILRVISEAMADDSRLLLSEQIMSDPPQPQSAAVDLVMMNIGGKERTRAMFEDLAASAGLKVVQFHPAPGSDHGVVECVKGGVQ